MPKRITPQQERFVERYLVHSNATKAAIEAGYSKKTAHSQGPRLLEHVGIKQRIEQSQKRILRKTKLTQEAIANEFRRYGFAGDDDAFTGIEPKERLNALDKLSKYTGMYRDDRPVDDGIGSGDIEINAGGISVALRRVRGRGKKGRG